MILFTDKGSLFNRVSAGFNPEQYLNTLVGVVVSSPLALTQTIVGLAFCHAQTADTLTHRRHVVMPTDTSLSHAIHIMQTAAV